MQGWGGGERCVNMEYYFCQFVVCLMTLTVYSVM
jgi:hypothetical protein